MKELEFITELLENYNINYWIDSGTLLGLYRDGKILEHDNDIDISTWAEEENKLINIIPPLKAKGYKLRILNYNNYNFKYKFTPTQKNISLTVDINLFIKNEKVSLCPQPVGKEDIFTKSSLRIYMKIYKTYFNRPRFNRPPNNWLFKMYTWSIPNKYFEDIRKLPRTNIPIPADVERYLGFRYGNWKIPEKSWSFVKDDGGLTDIDIKKLIS